MRKTFLLSIVLMCTMVQGAWATDYSVKDDAGLRAAIADNGSVTIGDKTYPAPANMNEMFFEQEVPGMIWGTTTMAWAMLNKIFTPGFYNYMKNPDNFLSTPAMTGDAYEDMHNALVANNVCTGWQPLHRIQFAHSKGDMIVPYGNYLAFQDAHPDGEDDDELYDGDIR